jgi:glycosyltransferase involved in cell wall biosynthesis
VCQLLHSLTVGGAEVLAAALARDLRASFRFVFACLDEIGSLGERLRQEGFCVEVLARRPGIDFGCMRRLNRFFRKQRVRLVHAQQYTPFFYALGSRLWKAAPPVLFTEHGRFFPDHPNRRRMIYNRLMLRPRDRVVGVGESVRRALVDNEGIPERRVGRIYNGVDIGAFNGQQVDRRAVRQEMGLAADHLVIMQVARLDWLKDHLTALRAMGRLIHDNPSARLVLVGDGPERGAIEHEIERLGLDDYVRLLGLRHDVARLLKAADIFLLSSISEGIPVTVIEAMAAALPVVSTDVGGVSEMVVPGETGLLASAKADDQLAHALAALAGDPNLRRRLGTQGQRRAAAVFSRETMHTAYRHLYEEMLLA